MHSRSCMLPFWQRRRISKGKWGAVLVFCRLHGSRVVHEKAMRSLAIWSPAWTGMCAALLSCIRISLFTQCWYMVTPDISSLFLVPCRWKG